MMVHPDWMGTVAKGSLGERTLNSTLTVSAMHNSDRIMRDSERTRSVGSAFSAIRSQRDVLASRLFYCKIHKSVFFYCKTHNRCCKTPESAIFYCKIHKCAGWFAILKMITAIDNYAVPTNKTDTSAIAGPSKDHGYWRNICKENWNDRGRYKR